MNYIYDILLNFQNEYFEFYDWNESDPIFHIKKTPIIRVCDSDFLNIKYNGVRFDNEFLDRIYNKTQMFKKYDVCTLPYVCIICCSNDALGVKLNKCGDVTFKSSLLLEELEEILEMNCSIKSINYSVTKVLDKNDFKTRKQVLQSKFIVKCLKNILNNKQYDKLKYLYYECFGIKENNVDTIYNSLLEETFKYNENYYKINDFLKLISQK